MSKQLRPAVAVQPAPLAAVAPQQTPARSDVQHLIPLNVRRVLEIGCAAGALGEALKRERPGLEVVGVEEKAEAAAVAATRLDAVYAGCVDALELPYPPGYFDCLVLADVLAHLPDAEATLERLLPYLQDGGQVVVSLPNIRHHLPLADLLFNGRFRYRDAGILDRAHLRFYTYHEIIEWMDRAGLNLVALDAKVVVPDPRLVQAMATMLAVVGGADDAAFTQEASVEQYLLRLEKPAPDAPHFSGARREPAGLPPAPAGQPPIASIVMLTLNQLPLTRLCVESLFAHASVPFELIVIDNGSTDDTHAYLRELAAREPRVRVHFNQTNMGFGQGCNQGMAMAEGEFVVLLNNDTVVTEGWLEGLLKPMQEAPTIGATGPRTNACLGPQKLAFVPYGRDMAEMQLFASWHQHMHRGQAFEESRLIGFCVAIRRAVLQKIGGFDPAFGLGNFEDDDLSLRIATAGFRLCVTDEVFIHHFGHATFRGEGIDYKRLMEENMARLARKWGFTPRSDAAYPRSELARKAFDPARDVRAILAATAPPAPISSAKRFRFLALPDWSHPEPAIAAIAAFAQAFRASDDVALLLWVDPDGPHALARVAEELGARLAASGLGGADNPEWVLFDAPGDPLHISRVYRTAQACLPLEDAAIAGAAQACGLHVPGDLSRSALRRAMGLES